MALLNLPRSFHVNSAGTPYGLAKLYTYRAGTLTNLTTYTTSALNVAASNPILADANGLFPAIYIDPASGFDIRVILKTSANVTIYDEDSIPRAPTALGAVSFSGNISATGTVAATSDVTSGSKFQVSAANPRIIMVESDAAADKKNWDISADSAVLSIRTRTDADAVGKDILTVTRGASTALASMVIGNSSDLAPITHYGKQTFSSASAVTTSDQIAVTKVKSANTARTSVTILSNDPDLTYAIPAAGTYRIEVNVSFHGTTSGAQGLDCNINFSGSFTFGRFFVFSYVNTISGSVVTIPISSTTTAIAQTFATLSTTQAADGALFTGFLTTINAGTIALSWAQHSSSVNATNVGGGSYMTVTKVS